MNQTRSHESEKPQTCCRKGAFHESVNVLADHRHKRSLVSSPAKYNPIPARHAGSSRGFVMPACQKSDAAHHPLTGVVLKTGVIVAIGQGLCGTWEWNPRSRPGQCLCCRTQMANRPASRSPERIGATERSGDNYAGEKSYDGCEQNKWALRH